jgi:hypothetical protein
MAKVRASVWVRGVDASQMLAEGLRRLSELSDGDWQVEEAFFSADGGAETAYIASDDGMMPMWSGNVTGIATIDPAEA